MTPMSLAPTPVWAQSANPVEEGTLHLGPFDVMPGLTVSTGVDSNVLAEETNPKSDMTTVANPRVRISLRSRPVTFEVRNSTDVITFRQYREQGGFNTRNDIRVDFPVNRVRLFAAHSFMTTEQRASLEIDARARRRETSLTGGADIRTTSKTTVRLSATHAAMAFDEDASNLGVNLAETLNRHVNIGSAALRYQLTGATTLTFGADAMQENFDLSPMRDSTSVRVAPGVEFDPRAIINGRAYVGYRSFTITSGAAPRYTGLVYAVELTSVLRDVTRLGVHVNRDVAYSFDVTTPYYVMTGGGATVGRRFADRWEMSASAARQNLLYRSVVVSPVVSRNGLWGIRKDYVYTFGAGVTYLFNDRLRLGFGIDRAQRQSELNHRGYEGTRFMAQFGYGS